MKGKASKHSRSAETSGLTRRKVVAAGAATGAFALAAPWVRKAEAATLNLRMLMWSDYNMGPTVQPFEKKYNCKISPAFFDGNSEAYNKMRAGGTKDFDLVQGDGFWPRLYYSKGLTQTVDYSKIPNLKKAYPDFMPPKFNYFRQEGGTDMVAAPNCWGDYGITMNASKIDAADMDTLTVLLNPKYRGHLSSTSRFEENTALMALIATYRMGTRDQPRPDGKPFSPYVLTDAELAETKKLLLENKKLLLSRYQDYNALTRLMRTGAVWASPEFDLTFRDLYKLRKEGKINFDTKHMIKGKEGGLGWVDTWMISSGVKTDEKRQLCHEWINHYLSPENMKRVVNHVGVSPTIDIRYLLDPETIKLFFMDRTNELSGLYLFAQPSSPEKWEKVWSAVEAS